MDALKDFPDDFELGVITEELYLSIFDIFLFSKIDNKFEIKIQTTLPANRGYERYNSSLILKIIAKSFKASKKVKIFYKEESLQFQDEGMIDFQVFDSFGFPTIGELMNEILNELSYLQKEIENEIYGFHWRKEYESNEQKFSIEVIQPLLKMMGFMSVIYNHGTREYGKDFTFTELDKFYQLRHYGAQIKAGNISGKIKGQIDEIISQIEDSFSMPFFEIGSKEPKYISTLLIIISGKFTSNAKEKIAYKINKGLWGTVYFLDKEKILELTDRFWKKN